MTAFGTGGRLAGFSGVAPGLREDQRHLQRPQRYNRRLQRVFYTSALFSVPHCDESPPVLRSQTRRGKYLTLSGILVSVLSRRRWRIRRGMHPPDVTATTQDAAPVRNRENAEPADALAPPGAQCRDIARLTRDHGAVADDHARERSPGRTPPRRLQPAVPSAVKTPGRRTCRAHPRSTGAAPRRLVEASRLSRRLNAGIRQVVLHDRLKAGVGPQAESGGPSVVEDGRP
ncbi:hypothetical protein OG996_01505 [Streptomyces sp. NBC_00366]|nr:MULTISPECIES: hypothetical protein [unclassified Streptomyces]